MAAKPRLVFVPGLGANGAVYGPLLVALSKQYDIRPADSPLQMPERLDDRFFFDSIDQAAGGAKRFILLGHSMGGGIALRYAARHPRRVIRTVAVAPVLFPFRGGRRRTLERLRNLWQAFRSGNLGHMFSVLQIIKERAGGGRARKLYRYSRSLNLTDDLPKVKNAVILWPQHEEIIPLAHYRAVRGVHPGIVTEEIPGNHHTTSLAPDPIVPIIRRCLETDG